MGSLFRLNSPLFRFLSKTVDIVMLNFLFIICSIPIITIGVSFTALYTVSMKIVRGEDYYIWSEFFKAIRKNIYQSTIIWILICLVGFILFADFYFLSNFTGIVKIFFFCLSVIFLFLYITISIFVFPYIARFEDSIQKVLLNSLLIPLFHFPYLLLIMGFTVICFLSFVSSFAGFLSGIYIATFGGFALFSLLLSLIFKKIFSKYEAPKVYA